MARMPGARWRPLSRNYTRRVTPKDSIILHSTGTNVATSQYGWFNTKGAGASSHFHVAFDGTIEQYVDTAHMSWANAAANSRSVTIETQGNGYGPWTAAQIRSIVRIIQWTRSVYKGIPLRQMTSSAASQKGIGWHRLGVNGNFPRTGILRGRSQRGGGQSWSKAFGKICPGDDRIQQIPAIIRQANGHTTPASTPQPKGQLSMSDVNKILKELDSLDTRIGSRATRSQVNAVYVRQREYQNEMLSEVGKRATRNMVNSVYVRQREYQAELEEMIHQLAEATGVTIDYDKVREAAKKGAKEALEEGIDIEAEAEVTFHNESEDQNDEGE